MSRLSTLLFGLGVGAGMMYFLDPDNGERRQKLVRDQVIRWRNQGDEAIETGIHDLRNRAKGMLAEATAYVGNEPASDWVLSERVRAKLGVLTRHGSAIQVDVREGRAVLSGDALADEVDRIAQGVALVRGIKGVENHIRTHADASQIPALQPVSRPEDGHNGKIWTPSTRLLAGIGGGTLVLYGAARGGFIGRLINLTGWGLAIRSATNLQIGSLLGMTEERKIIRVNKTIQIPAPVEQVYDFWSNYTNFPSFMSHIREITDTGNGKSHWVVDGPAGTSIEWDAVTTDNVPNELIAWESVPGAMVKNMGEVRFQRVNENTTQVNVRMYYNPPAGAVGHAVAELFGADPKSAMDDDLNTMKSILAGGQSRPRGQRRTSGAPSGIPATGETSTGEAHSSQLPSGGKSSGESSEGGINPSSGEAEGGG